MRTINLLLIGAIFLFATVMAWTYSAVRGTDQTFQAGIGGGPGDTGVSATKPDYRALFGTLIPEHGNTAIIHVSLLYDGKDSTETARLLEDNAEKLANVIKTLGTATDRELFYRTFRAHSLEYEAYTKAIKANDQKAMDTAKEHLQMHSMDFGKLIHKLMPTISEEEGTKLMNDHTVQTIAVIDAHASGDTAKKLSESSKANAQAIVFAHALTKGAEEATK